MTPLTAHEILGNWATLICPWNADESLGILCNPEIIDINQDPLGKKARIDRQNRHEFILAKPLEHGSTAAGIFNLAPFPRDVSIALADLGLTGLTHTCQSSTTLAAWSDCTPASESSNNDDPVETITVTIPPALPAEPGIFLRIEAKQP